ncbi:splicing regulatory glutamine/lysine-rich protein 1-like [Sinocyclocheilus grahami]|uniref:splicing regulatory glutamine/lysine-rich protein 1-like n=1 Tax=Sinocyclocheilus grahami TaxID=75366 RepID=UPI0007AD168C|nr:PREDICTED: splicing regulatory glutamine/lysine-rich protein 1-like [Sinocyclocheilus grahami]
MKKVREAQSTIAASIEPDDKIGSSSRSRRSRRSRSHSRSPSHSRRKRSRSRHRGRLSQRPRQSVNDSRGPHRRRSCSRERKHSRSLSHSRDQRKDKDSKARKDDDWEETRPRDKKGRMPPKGYSGSRCSHSISRSEESVRIKPATDFACLKMERCYEEVDHEYDSDMDGSGSVGSDDRSPQAHLNGSYRSTYTEEDDLSAAE